MVDAKLKCIDIKDFISLKFFLICFCYDSADAFPHRKVHLQPSKKVGNGIGMFLGEKLGINY